MVGGSLDWEGPCIIGHKPWYFGAQFLLGH